MTISIVYLFYSLSIKPPKTLIPCFSFTSISHMVTEVFEWEVGRSDFLRPHHPELFHQPTQPTANNSFQCQAELQTPKPVFNRHKEAEPTMDFQHRKDFIWASLSVEASLWHSKQDTEHFCAPLNPTASRSSGLVPLGKSGMGVWCPFPSPPPP